MASDYIHVDVETVQSPKKVGKPCGDVVSYRRTGAGTLVICADGAGSGIRAHIGAQMCVARLFESVLQGFSFRKAFSKVVETMQQSRDPDKPFVAFSMAHIRPDGNATVLSYDAPAPIFVGRHGASVLPNRPFSLHDGLAVESNCPLNIGEGILLMSDGVTQAGIGYGPNSEWGTDGVVRLVGESLARNLSLEMIPHLVHRESLQRWKGNFGDDCSVTLAYCRNGQTLNILTGPPVDRETDHDVIARFLEMPGIHVVCGGTTANIVASYLNEPLQVEQEPTSTIAPPRYAIHGIDLVTEGAITLNQVYNIMDENMDDLSEDSGVTELRLLLNVADRVNFIVGGAKNTANNDISFLQRGVLSRKILVPHLAERLERDCKLVTVKYV